MNCSQTCCKQTFCAENLDQCIHYKHREYMELYICVIVVLSIVVGIPTCIKSMEFMLMFKFCQKFDEDENASVGGVTICEALTNLFAKKHKEEGATGGPSEEVVFEENEVIDDEYADTEAGTAMV